MDTSPTSTTATAAQQPAHLSVSFELKNQVKLFIGERSKTQFDSGCKMFDLMLKDPYRVTHSQNKLSKVSSTKFITFYFISFKFDTITFQNVYTGYLSIKAKVRYSSEKKVQFLKFLIF
jgi:hypothetical protein